MHSTSFFVFRSHNHFQSLRYQTQTYLELDKISVSHNFLFHTPPIPLFPCTQLVFSTVGYHCRFFDCHGYWLSYHMGDVLLSLENTGSGFKVLFLVSYLIFTDWHHYRLSETISTIIQYTLGSGLITRLVLNTFREPIIFLSLTVPFHSQRCSL